MNNNEKNIENLFGKGLKNHRVNPSERVWRKISMRLAWQNYTRFDLKHFNIYYTAGLITAGIIGVILFTDLSNGKSKEVAPVEIKDNKTVTDTGNSSKLVLPSEKINNDTSSENLVEKEQINSEHKTEKAEKLQRAEKKENQPEKEAGKISETVKSSSKRVKTLIKEDESIISNSKLKENSKKTLIADFSMSGNSGCVSLPVEFWDHSENAVSYVWHFGDGGTSIEKNPKYIYDKPGRYNVIHEVTNKNGEGANHSETVNVFPKPEVQFEIYPENVELENNPVNFYNYSKNAVRYEWDFGDSESSTDIEPVHFYSNYGNYDVMLIAWSDKGCVDSLVIKNAFTQSNFMIEFPNAFSPNKNGPCNGYYERGTINNDVFHPVYRGVLEYQLKIFSSSGQLIFESSDINIGWDGYYNEKLVGRDVYIWKATGRFSNGKPFVKSGDITLIY